MNKKKILILLLTFVVLFFVLTTPLSRLGRFNQNKFNLPPQAGEVITVPEMKAFLETWSRFLQKDIGKYGVQQVSLTGAKPSEGFSPYLVRWLKKEGWNADRFFYVEQRLKAIVKTALLAENIDSNKKILEQRRREGKDGTVSNIMKIIEAQEKQFNTEKVTPQELDMVKGTLYQINAILEGKAIYEP